MLSVLSTFRNISRFCKGLLARYGSVIRFQVESKDFHEDAHCFEKNWRTSTISCPSGGRYNCDIGWSWIHDSFSRRYRFSSTSFQAVPSSTKIFRGNLQPCLVDVVPFDLYTYVICCFHLVTDRYLPKIIPPRMKTCDLQGRPSSTRLTGSLHHRSIPLPS